MRPTYKRFKGELFEGVREVAVRHEWHHFRDCRWWGCHYREVEWYHCRFNITAFANRTAFDQCRFADCRFWGQHTHLGGPSKYADCVFDNCEFRDVTFCGTTFDDCAVSGVFENVNFYGKAAPKDWQTRLTSVDLSQVTMRDVQFLAGIDLTSVSFPESGVRVLRNPQGVLAQRVGELSATYGGLTRRILSSFAIIYERQDPVVLCDNLPIAELDEPSAIDAFERLAMEYAAYQQHAADGAPRRR